MVRSISLLAALLLVSSASAQTTLNWYPLFEGQANPYVSDSAGGSPTMTLFNIEGANVAFSSINLRVTVPDINLSDFYDIGIGACPNNDCSQPSQPITILCNLGGVTLSNKGAQQFPCLQGNVVLTAGTYIYLGVGSAANIAKCQGQQGSASITPFATTVIGTSVNGNLSNIVIGGKPAPNFITPSAGIRSAADICTISLH